MTDTRFHKSNKLTIEDIKEIKKLLSKKENQYTIAEKFGVSQSKISEIKRGLAGHTRG